MKISNSVSHNQPLPRISCTGFGGYCSAEQNFIRPERFNDVKAALLQSHVSTIMPRGLGRSYGDAALNGSGTLLFMERLDRFLEFNQDTHVLRVEAGVRLLDVMRIIVPYGLTLAAVPGLSDISVGGCVAFDIHTKNHWHSGGFGDWVILLRMMLVSGEVVDCSRTQNSDLFYATVGGLGLTGIILEVEIRLQSLPGTCVQNTSQSFAGVEDLLEKFQVAIVGATHAVAWIDMLNSKTLAGTLIASSVLDDATSLTVPLWGLKKQRPLEFISPVFNSLSNRIFNMLFAAKHKLKSQTVTDLRSFLFPWDALSNWNRLYGNSGFVEYQCCIPLQQAKGGLEKILSLVRTESRSFPVFFAAVKRMRDGIGMLSFPIEGFSLLLDFPVKPGIWGFLDKIDDIVISHGGRVFLAKDGRLSPSAFKHMYPRRDEWLKIRTAVDPQKRLASNMGRRLGLDCR